MKVCWLSFADGERGHFLGVAIVEIDDDDIREAQADLNARFPNHLPNAAIVAASVRKAWLMGCNPGGSVMCNELPLDHPGPRHRLLSKAALIAEGLIDG